VRSDRTGIACTLMLAAATRASMVPLQVCAPTKATVEQANREMEAGEWWVGIANCTHYCSHGANRRLKLVLMQQL
jgi:hypothetical protein